MITNKILQSVSMAAGLSEQEVQQSLACVQSSANIFVAEYWLQPDEPDFKPCPPEFVHCFLEGLRLHLRGPAPGEVVPFALAAQALDNNMILKKIRIALTLQAEQLDDLFERGGVMYSKHEISAMFRKPGHKHYKKCSNEVLGAFLESLCLRLAP